MVPIDYLVLGHVCEDLTPEGPLLGGTAAFAALTARALRRRVGIVTSAPARLEPLLEPLRSIPRVCIPAGHATQFENTYDARGRTQLLRSRATPIQLDDVPPGWRKPAVVHLAPVARELSPQLIGAFPGALVGVSAQGWLRDWDATGRVRVRDWREGPQVLADADAVVLSIEDLDGDEALATRYARRARLLVVTRSAAGATLYCHGRAIHVPAPARRPVAPTGAGDVFAAALFVRLHRGDEPAAAAKFAAQTAADFVGRPRGHPIPVRL